MLIEPKRDGRRLRRGSMWLGAAGVALGGVVFAAPSSWGLPSESGQNPSVAGAVDPSEPSPPYEQRRAADEARETNSARIPPEVIRSTVRSYYAGFRTCYEAQLPELASASVTLRFTIGRDGLVADGDAVDKTEPPSERSAALAQCLDGVMRSMQFPAPRDGIVTVEYPIYFEKGDETPANP